jgi:predicted kinase
VLDKDVVAESWSGPLLQALGQNPNDRDSPFFKEHVRDLQYQSTLRIAKDQLDIGLNVILPGPWNRELASGALFSTQELGFPAATRLLHIWLDLPEAVRQQRIIQRGDPRDQWKLDHWHAYFSALKRPAAVQDGRVAALDASLPIAEQCRILEELVKDSG